MRPMLVHHRVVTTILIINESVHDRGAKLGSALAPDVNVVFFPPFLRPNVRHIIQSPSLEAEERR